MTSPTPEPHGSPELTFVRHLGRRAYQETLTAMQSVTAARDAATPDEIWTVEHPAVFTQGQAGQAEHLLAPGPIPVVQSDRGGQVTYHGPGQLVIYVLLDLRRLSIGVRSLVNGLEQSVIDFLRDHGVEGNRLDGAPGVYVEGCKVSALGLRVRRGCTYHGLSLNVRMDLRPFSRINPCGYAGLEVTDLHRLGIGCSMDDAALWFVQRLQHQFGLQPLGEAS
ncbi:MAG: lipoyl(octanoyl) transferase LipB [Pseudomonadota bacterium]